MANRTSHPFTISGQHRSDLSEQLLPDHAVVATLTLPPRAQLTPEERTALRSGAVRHQWGLGIGPDACNKFYVMHRALETDFERAELAVQFKSNPGQTQSHQCHENGYTASSVLYTGPDLGVLVVARSADGLTLHVRAYDLYGRTVLHAGYSAPTPWHWQGNCGISLRGDNCFADGVITV